MRQFQQLCFRSFSRILSIGGNAELLPGADGAVDFLPAVVGYDAAGILTAAQPDLTDTSDVGRSGPDETDARGASLALRLAALMAAAGRRLMALTGRSVLRAVMRGAARIRGCFPCGNVPGG